MDFAEHYTVHNEVVSVYLSLQERGIRLFTYKSFRGHYLSLSLYVFGIHESKLGYVLRIYIVNYFPFSRIFSTPKNTFFLRLPIDGPPIGVRLG